jgi:hypothetical protein
LFERPHHRRIADILQSLDPMQLVSRGCLFGGGTAIALRWGEFRESVDIDFLVSHQPGYRELRQVLTGRDGVAVLARQGCILKQIREVRADPYGIRTMLEVEGVPIKFAIVLEGRITLDAPALDDQVCGIPTLTPLDLATSKLLANADRWGDAAVFSRDLIDLAMMAPDKALLARAVAKAEVPYGTSIRAAMSKAIAYLLDPPGRLEQCCRQMRITVPKATIAQNIRTLQKRLRPSPTGMPGPARGPHNS